MSIKIINSKDKSIDSLFYDIYVKICGLKEDDKIHINIMGNSGGNIATMVAAAHLINSEDRITRVTFADKLRSAGACLYNMVDPSKRVLTKNAILKYHREKSGMSSQLGIFSHEYILKVHATTLVNLFSVFSSWMTDELYDKYIDRYLTRKWMVVTAKDVHKTKDMKLVCRADDIKFKRVYIHPEDSLDKIFDTVVNVSEDTELVVQTDEIPFAGILSTFETLAYSIAGNTNIKRILDYNTVALNVTFIYILNEACIALGRNDLAYIIPSGSVYNTMLTTIRISDIQYPVNDSNCAIVTETDLHEIHIGDKDDYGMRYVSDLLKYSYGIIKALYPYEITLKDYSELVYTYMSGVSSHMYTPHNVTDDMYAAIDAVSSNCKIAFINLHSDTSRDLSEHYPYILEVAGGGNYIRKKE